jgi:hypothetical protein
MSQAHRREEKKRQREKRLAKRTKAERSVETLINTLRDLADVPLPGSFPGACDPSLERPDHVKFELANFTNQGPGRDHLRRLERQAKQGILGFVPEIDHWCMEEFFWHGAPDTDWNPVDRFLATAAERFPPAARQQIARWKQARIGFYEVGDCADDLVALRELDPLTLQPAGAWMRAIALNIGGVNHYIKQNGLINLTYVAPWAPEQNIHCAMGYGVGLPRGDCAMAAPLILGMRNAKAITFPLPWKVGKVAHQQFVEQWIRRNWHAWMKERIRLPFQAAVILGPQKAKIVRIDDMVTRTAEEARRLGLYFAAELTPGEVGILGATAVTPVEVDSPNALAFAEYHEYRRLAGPPPATRGF